jgi:membrane-bound inhibitor of C-type lysozyme
MRRSVLAVAALGATASCAERTDMGQVMPDQTPCASTLDAIAYTCTDGLSFSVRPNPDGQCVVLFLYDNTLLLPYDAARGAYTNGAVTFEQSGSSATLSRITSGATSQCEMVE